MNFCQRQRNKNNLGFTLIEVLVASTIFVLLISIVTGIFLGVVAAQRKTVAIRTLQDSVRFAIEAMSRDIRTGYGFSLYGPHELRFTSTIGGRIQQVSYRLNGSVLEKGIPDGAGGYTFLALTPPNVTIDYLYFYLQGEALGDGRQPLITITLGASAGQGGQETKINIQTTLSQRELQS